ncbi:conserved hypothetical protein [Ricinus communis]|uniref:BSD domain-containing protein n=1 Tax=Ricinus communis TaxID=3988 RepID=B9T129_RICCO|nr:conserved hypothetical protein [Ricinus communis]|eukprot:XP_002531948.1 uncharacterized protein LOC8272211 [Ricinus communis]
MSWLFKSFQSSDPDSSSSSSPKDDISVISDSISRQLRGVANFLAPPPSPPSPSENKSEPLDSQSQALQGIRNDLAEIGGSLKSGLSLLSTNKAVTEISKFTSSLLQFQSNSNYRDNDDDYEDDDDDVAGITNEVIDFVKEISSRPECWTDFPLSLHYDFKMSDAQREHASIVEHFVPSLKALRANLHGHMGDEQFWLIYFILLLPRLNEHDIEILSTPQIVETRNILLQKLQNKKNLKVENSDPASLHISQDSSKITERAEDNIPSQGKEVTEIANATGRLEIDDEESADQWLKETEINTDTTLDGQKKLEHEEDVSFSDLENDDNDLASRLSGSKKAQEITRVPSPSGSSDWVQLNESSETQAGLQKARQSISREKDSDGESNDWLKVDDFD